MAGGVLPAVTPVPEKSHDFVRCYRFAGGDLAPEWAASIERRGEGRTAWCEVSVWIGGDGRPDSFVSSYGGSVWPTAWPTLFEAAPSSASMGSGGILLTAAGRALIEAAPPATPEVPRIAFPREAPPASGSVCTAHYCYWPRCAPLGCERPTNAGAPMLAKEVP